MVGGPLSHSIYKREVGITARIMRFNGAAAIPPTVNLNRSKACCQRRDAPPPPSPLQATGTPLDRHLVSSPAASSTDVHEDYTEPELFLHWTPTTPRHRRLRCCCVATEKGEEAYRIHGYTQRYTPTILTMVLELGCLCVTLTLTG